MESDYCTDSIITQLKLSLMLENAFKSVGFANACRDSFELRPSDHIEEGLSWLIAGGKIDGNEFSMLRELCDFGPENLAKTLEVIGMERFEELLVFLKNLDKKIEATLEEN